MVFSLQCMSDELISHCVTGECEVYLDLLDLESIKDMGIFSWIQERVELAQFVIVICSTGARFKCARNRQVKMKQERQVSQSSQFLNRARRSSC